MILVILIFNEGGRRDRDRMVVGYSTTYAMSSHHQ
jgi:hypothetical protein